MTSVINFINTGSSANSGDGDSLRTAFNKINLNFVNLENSYIQSGVTSFNGTGGLITFTATDIASLLGYIPANPVNFVSSSTVEGFATQLYVDATFAPKADYPSTIYLTNVLSEYATVAYITGQGFITNNTLPSFLNLYATQEWVEGQNYISSGTIKSYLTAQSGSLIPTTTEGISTSSTYDIGSNAYQWNDAYFANNVFIKNIAISIDTSTSKLLVNGQGVTSNFTLSPADLYNNNLTFSLRAGYKIPGPGEQPSNAFITIPSDADTSFVALSVINTGTAGLKITGKNTTVGIDEDGTSGVRIHGYLNLPLDLTTFDTTGDSGTDVLQIDPNLAVTVLPGTDPQPDLPLTLTAYNRAKTQQTGIRVRGTTVTLEARNQTSGVRAQLTDEGLKFGTLEWQGYTLPITTASGMITGSVLTMGPLGITYWSTSTIGNGNVNSNNAIFTTATVLTSFRLGTNGLDFLDGSSMPTAYGNQQVADYLPQYNGVVGTDYIQGQGTDVNLIANGLTWTFSSTGTFALPGGAIITDEYWTAKAGGTVNLESSNKQNYVWVSDAGANIAVNTSSWAFSTDGSLTLPMGAKLKEYDITDGAYYYSKVSALQAIESAAGEVVSLLTRGDGHSQLVWIGADSLASLNGADISCSYTSVSTSSYSQILTAEYGARIVNRDSTGTTYQWSFSQDGETTFPSNTIKSPSALSIQVPTSTPPSLTNWNGQGGWNQGLYSNLATTGGSGTGLTVDVAAGGGGYININLITVNNPGSGYTNGDVITIDNENNLPGTFTLVLAENIWDFGTNGSITFPDNTVQTTAYVPSAVIGKTTGTWTLATGANTVSITVPLNGNYQMWVNGNIPNGIVEWNATVNVSNPNVPAIGSQYAWYYATGDALVLTAIPDQIIGTLGVISSSTSYSGNTSNVFTFDITNNSGSSQVINWGYTTL